MKPIILVAVLLCTTSCRSTDLHNVIKGQQAQINMQQELITKLTAEVERSRYCEVSCDKMEAQVAHAASEVVVWKELAEGCTNEKIEMHAQ